MRHPYRTICCFTLAATALGSAHTTVRACSLDGIASLSMDHNVASGTTRLPSKGDLRRWAPFTFIAAAPGQVLRVAEDRRKLSASLPPGVLSAPFRWDFGDGSVVIGQQATHRYAGLGRYRITVSYALGGRWVVFDSAEEPIIPSGDLLGANADYYTGKLAAALSGALDWLDMGALAACAAWFWFSWGRARPAVGRRARAARGERPLPSGQHDDTGEEAGTGGRSVANARSSAGWRIVR